MSETVVIIPTFNERENLRTIVERALAAAPTVDLLVVDDNSPDGTGALAEELASQDDRIHVLHRPGKQGLGMAYLAGFDWARTHGYRSVVEMDADGSHPPEALPRMLQLLADHDVVLGSRWVPGGEVENWSRRRELLSRSANLYARLALGIDVGDATGGFRAFTIESLDRIGLGSVHSQGYCFQVELVWRALQAGLRVVEFPITFSERVFGYSKMSGGIVREALVQVTLWGIRRRVLAIREVVLHRRRLPSVRRTSSRVRRG